MLNAKISLGPSKLPLKARFKGYKRSFWATHSKNPDPQKNQE